MAFVQITAGQAKEKLSSGRVWNDSYGRKFLWAVRDGNTGWLCESEFYEEDFDDFATSPFITWYEETTDPFPTEYHEVSLDEAREALRQGKRAAFDYGPQARPLFELRETDRLEYAVPCGGWVDVVPVGLRRFFVEGLAASPPEEEAEKFAAPEPVVDQDDLDLYEMLEDKISGDWEIEVRITCFSHGDLLHRLTYCLDEVTPTLRDAALAAVRRMTNEVE